MATTDLTNIKFQMRNAVMDGALDPEFVLHVNDTLPAGDPYRRLVNTVAIMYGALGDEFVIRTLNLDPRDHVL